METSSICALLNCKNGFARHVYISGSCEDMDDARLTDKDGQLDVNETEESRLEAQRLYGMPIDESSFLKGSEFSSSPHSEDEDDNEETGRIYDKDDSRFTLFFNYWKSANQQSELFDTPLSLVDSVIRDSAFADFRHQYHVNYIELARLPSSVSKAIILDLVCEASEESFKNLHLIIKGAKCATKAQKEKDLQTLLTSFESQVSFLTESVGTIKDCMYNVDISSGNLREAVNLVSEVSHKISAECKMLDLSKERNPANMPKTLYQPPADMEIKIPIIQCGEIIVPFHDNGKVDVGRIDLLNKTISQSNKHIILSLATLRRDCVPQILSVSWSSIVKLTDIDPTKDNKEKALEIWKRFYEKYGSRNPMKKTQMTMTSRG